MTTYDRSQAFASAAWLLRGISSVPGQLVLNSGLLSFSTNHPGSAWPWQIRKLERQLGAEGFAQALLAGEQCTLFQWRMGSFAWHSPWYVFGGGINLTHNGQKLRISFGDQTSGMNEVDAMRKLGQAWLEVLGQASQP